LSFPRLYKSLFCAFLNHIHTTVANDKTKNKKTAKPIQSAITLSLLLPTLTLTWPLMYSGSNAARVCSSLQREHSSRSQVSISSFSRFKSDAPLFDSITHSFCHSERQYLSLLTPLPSIRPSDGVKKANSRTSSNTQWSFRSDSLEILMVRLFFLSF